MKTLFAFFGICLFCSIFLLQAQNQPTMTFSTVNQIRIKERIDTVVIFDPATLLETVRIMKYKSINLDLNNCPELASEVSLGFTKANAKELSDCGSLYILCKPDGQIKEWTVQSFTMAIQKKGQELQKFTAMGPNFSEAMSQAVANLESGTTLYFENIKLAMPELPVVSLSFGVEVN